MREEDYLTRRRRRCVQAPGPTGAVRAIELLSGAARMSPAVRHLRRYGQRIHGQMLLPVHMRAILPQL